MKKGRPLSGKPRRIKFTVTFDPDQFDFISQYVSRSAVIEKALRILIAIEDLGEEGAISATKIYFQNERDEKQRQTTE